jgi:hypothetical protein
MTESARRFKANKSIDGRTCAPCGNPIPFGADVAVCAACETAHHAGCWDEKGGCSKEGCLNAPLAQMAPPPLAAAPAPAANLRPGMRQCPHCGRVYATSQPICPKCQRAPNPSGVYDGPKVNAPGAVASLVLGILSLLICGIIFGIFAISKSNEAKRAIAANPAYGGAGLATAGLVLGIIGILGSVVLLLAKLS